MDAHHYCELQHLFDLPLDRVKYGNKHMLYHNYLDNSLLVSLSAFVFSCILFCTFENFILRSVYRLHYAVTMLVWDTSLETSALVPGMHLGEEHANICLGKIGGNVGYVTKSWDPGSHPRCPLIPYSLACCSNPQGYPVQHNLSSSAGHRNTCVLQNRKG